MNDVHPLSRARIVLGARLTEASRPGGGWRLDGRPAGPAQVVAAANAVLARKGLAPIAYPGVCMLAGRGA